MVCVLDDEDLKERIRILLLQEDACRGEDTEKAFVLTERNLKNYVKAEFSVFLLFLEFMLRKKHGDAMGNRFAQALHDGGTLESKKKYQALALQFIAPGWVKNLVITIALKKSSNNKDTDVADLWKEVVAERCGGLQFEDIVGRMRSDRAAKGVAGVLDMGEEEVCEMHDTDTDRSRDLKSRQK